MKKETLGFGWAANYLLKRKIKPPTDEGYCVQMVHYLRFGNGVPGEATTKAERIRTIHDIQLEWEGRIIKHKESSQEGVIQSFVPRSTEEVQRVLNLVNHNYVLQHDIQISPLLFSIKWNNGEVTVEEPRAVSTSGGIKRRLV